MCRKSEMKVYYLYFPRFSTACWRLTLWRPGPLCDRPWLYWPQLCLLGWRTATRCWPTGLVRSLWRRGTLYHSWSTYCISLCSTSGWADIESKKVLIPIVCIWVNGLDRTVKKILISVPVALRDLSDTTKKSLKFLINECLTLPEVREWLPLQFIHIFYCCQLPAQCGFGNCREPHWENCWEAIFADYLSALNCMMPLNQP